MDATHLRERPLDLSDAAVDAFVEHRGPGLSSIIRDMSSHEAWPADRDPVVVDALQRLAKQLAPEDIARLATDPNADLMEILGYVGAGRFFLFLDRLVSAIADFGMEAPDLFVNAYANSDSHETHAAIAACLARLTHLERQRCLRLVYAPGRVLALATALKEISCA